MTRRRTAAVLIFLSAVATFALAQSAATTPMQVVTIKRFTDLSTPWGSVTQNRFRPRPQVPGGDPSIWQPARATTPPFEPWASGGGIWEIITRKHGRGFRVVCTDEMTTPWGGKTAFLTDSDHLVRMGYTEDWSGKFLFPSRGNREGFPRGWHAGLLWEFHTQTTSGHHISVDGGHGRPHLRFSIWDSTANRNYHFIHDRKLIQFDRWYSWRLKIKWSYGSDGFIQGWLDGKRLVDLTGPTVPEGEKPYLQFGYYSVAERRNEVWHAAIRRN